MLHRIHVLMCPETLWDIEHDLPGIERISVFVHCVSCGWTSRVEQALLDPPHLQDLVQRVGDLVQEHLGWSPP